MRKFFAGLIILAGLSVLPAVAHAQCLFCFGLGYLVGSSGEVGEQSQQMSQKDLWILPDIAERVTDPLQVRQLSATCYRNITYGASTGAAPSIKESFDYEIKKLIEYEKLAKKAYTIIRVSEWSPSSGSDCVGFKFLFIESSLLKPPKAATQ